MGSAAAIQSNGRHLLGLINDILDTLQDRGGPVAAFRNGLLDEGGGREGGDCHRGLAAEKKLLLRAIVPETLRPETGDERRITQVLLISSATPSSSPKR